MFSGFACWRAQPDSHFLSLSMLCVRKMTDDAMRSGAAFPAAAAATLPAAQGADAASDRPRHLALPHGAYVFSHDMTWHADVDPCVDTPDHEIQYRSFLRALTNKNKIMHV